MTITKDMTISKVMSEHPEVAKVLAKHGFHCFGCHMARMETIEQGAKAHGIDIDKLVEEMNQSIKKKEVKE